MAMTPLQTLIATLTDATNLSPESPATVTQLLAVAVEVAAEVADLQTTGELVNAWERSSHDAAAKRARRAEANGTVLQHERDAAHADVERLTKDSDRYRDECKRIMELSTERALDLDRLRAERDEMKRIVDEAYNQRDALAAEVKAIAERVERETVEAIAKFVDEFDNTRNATLAGHIRLGRWKEST